MVNSKWTAFSSELYRFPPPPDCAQATKSIFAECQRRNSHRGTALGALKRDIKKQSVNALDLPLTHRQGLCRPIKPFFSAPLQCLVSGIVFPLLCHLELRWANVQSATLASWGGILPQTACYSVCACACVCVCVLECMHALMYVQDCVHVCTYVHVCT